MQAGSERDITRDPRRRDRWILTVAVVLTLVMFGWQGVHLYSASAAISREETVSLVEALHSAGEHQIGLVEDLEHDAVVVGRDLAPDGVAEWAERYEAATAETRIAAAAARAVVGEGLAGAVDLVDAARLRLDARVDDVVQVVSTGDDAEVVAAISDPRYLAAQAELAEAIDGQIAELAAELAAAAAEHRVDEFHSVTIALVLFTTAIGAWGIFGRHLRRSRERLADEQERRLQAEADLSQMQKMEALGLMADGIAHDVKNLTVVILGSTDEVRRGLPDGHRATTALTRIEEATRQADDLARSLLAFSRDADAPAGAVDLAALAVDMRPLLRYMVPPSIELTVRAHDAAWVRGDAARLQQTIFNLVANAREAMPDGGRIDITVRRPRSVDDDGPEWHLVVEDSGEGMPPDVVDHVFDPFFTTRSAGTGSGLGLAIVHRTVLDHDGWIAVASRPGEGTRFTIGLPAAPPPGPVRSAPDRDRPRVLVAVPDSHVGGLIAGALAVDGCRTRAASGADEVRSFVAADRDPIDLVVVDARILEPDLVARMSHLPVVVIGRPVSPLDPEEHAELHVLDEPLSLADLVRTVTSLLRPVDSLVPS